MRLAFGFAIALWLSFRAAGLACRQQEPAGPTKAPAQGPAAPAPKQTAPEERAPAQKSPAETEPEKKAPTKTTPAPAEQAPAETTPAAPANPPTPAAEKKAPDGEVKQETDAGSAGGTDVPGRVAGGADVDETQQQRSTR